MSESYLFEKLVAVKNIF